MSEELQELHEHAEHAQHDPTLAPVSLTMAVFAVAVAVVTLMSHRAHTEEVVLQAKASDQWSYYQAKNIREHEDALFADFAAVGTSINTEAMAKFREKTAQEAERYKHEKEEVRKNAEDLERESGVERRRANRYDLAEVFLEIALVITSITLLSGRRIYWYAGIVLSVVGAVIVAIGTVVH